MGEHVDDVLHRVEHVVAEDIDFILEDSQNLANWSDIKEGVHRSKQDLFKGVLEDTRAKVALPFLLEVAPEL